MQLDGYHEQRRRGSPAFPVELYRVDKWHPRYQMAYHWHMELELIRIVQGTFRYELDGNNGTAKAGDILFVNCGVLHAGQPQHGALYECIVLDPSVLIRKGLPGSAELASLAQGETRLQSHITAADTALHPLCHSLFDTLAKQEERAPLTILGLLYQLFGAAFSGGLCHAAAHGSGSAGRIRKLKRVLELIDESYSSTLTLEQMAAAAGMTPKYFCSFFREMTHQSPIDYLNAHRVEVACVLLAMPGASITEAAYECGFNDTSYFIRVFKKYKGITPGQYIHKRLKKEEERHA